MYLFASWSSNHTKCQLNCHCITIKILFQDKAKEKKNRKKKTNSLTTKPHSLTIRNFKLLCVMEFCLGCNSHKFENRTTVH